MRGGEGRGGRRSEQLYAPGNVSNRRYINHNIIIKREGGNGGRSVDR